jgi:hypothetical protein
VTQVTTSMQWTSPGSAIWAADYSDLLPTTHQFYARRFLTTYPHEQLPAGRPLHVTPAHAEPASLGAQFGVTWGLEVPQFFAPLEFVHEPSLQRELRPSVHRARGTGRSRPMWGHTRPASTPGTKCAAHRRKRGLTTCWPGGSRRLAGWP